MKQSVDSLSFMHQNQGILKCQKKLLPPAYLVRRKVMFSQVFVCSTLGGGELPHLHPKILPLVPCPFPGGTTVTSPRSLPGRIPVPGEGVSTPVPGGGYPSPRWGRYSSPWWGVSQVGSTPVLSSPGGIPGTGMRTRPGYPLARTGLWYSPSQDRIGVHPSGTGYAWTDYAAREILV